MAVPSRSFPRVFATLLFLGLIAGVIVLNRRNVVNVVSEPGRPAAPDAVARYGLPAVEIEQHVAAFIAGVTRSIQTSGSAFA